MTDLPAAAHDLSPATLSRLAFTTEQLARLDGLRPVNREHELGLIIYAHLYDQTCRARHVAILSHHADLALQACWQQHREAFLARARADYEAAVLVERAEACALGFDALGKDVSAEVTRSYAEALKSGMPAALYAYQIAAQEQRLADKRAEAANVEQVMLLVYRRAAA